MLHEFKDKLTGSGTLLCKFLGLKCGGVPNKIIITWSLFRIGIFSSIHCNSSQHHCGRKLLKQQDADLQPWSGITVETYKA